MIFEYNFKNYNFRMILYMLILSVLGVLLIGSASGRDSSTVMKQIQGVFIALIACFALSLIDYHRYFKFTALIYLGCVGFLIAVLLIGKDRKSVV